MTVTTSVLPMLLADVEVVSVERLTPTFVRVELGGPELADFGVDGPRYDQRIKLVFPDPETGGMTSTEGADETWLATWLDRPAAERGHMRTYTIRDVRGSGEQTTFVVDMVLHLEGDLVGPGSLWASTAAPGDRIVVLAPRRGLPYGGIEFAPEPGPDLLLVGDETAVPAVCSVLEQLPDDARGTAFLEVPVAADVQDVRRPAGVEVVWLAREGDRARPRPARRGRGAPRHPRARRSRSPRTRSIPTCGRPRPTRPRARRSPDDAGGVGGHLRLDRGGVEGRDRPAPAPGQRARLRPQPAWPSWATGAAASRCGPEPRRRCGSAPLRGAR